ncbi:MAG: tape measure protein [Fimbriimonadaceae bacterium]|nr:tape measure protein [Fimbriimonadaceae bacterium]
MARTTEEFITTFSVDDKYTSAVKKIAHQTKQLNTAVMPGTGQGMDGFANSLKFATAEMDSAIPGLQDLLGILKAVAIVGAAAGVALIGFGGYAMKTAADLEALKLGLRVYTKTSEEFEETLKRIKEIARLPGLGFEEAIQGATRLRAAGFDARLAERAMMGFGNALAAVGGGKDDLDGVLLALTQIATKSEVSAEEINQIAERVPQIRQLMLQAFGTANTESLQKMGMGTQEFIMRIIDAVETLPKAMGGAKNSFENFGDVAFRIIAQIGNALNEFFLPTLDKVVSFFDYLESQDVFGKVASGILESIGGMKSMENIAIRIAALITAGFEALPTIVATAMAFIKIKIEDARKSINSFIENLNKVIKVFEDMYNSKISRVLRGDVDPWADPDQSFGRIPLLGAGGGNSSDPVWGKVFGGVGKRADDILKGFGEFSNKGINDTSKGGFTFKAEDNIGRIALSTAQTARNTETMKDLQKAILGGGTFGNMGITPVELGAMKRQRNGGSKVEDAIRYLVAAVEQQTGGAVMQGMLSRARVTR